MASIMSAPLNAEPADEQGRAQAGLEPKSFADAVQEGAPAAVKVASNGDANKTNGSDSSRKSKGPSQANVQANAIKQEEKSNGQSHGFAAQTDENQPIGDEGVHRASVLRIVNTHPESEGQSGDEHKEQKSESRRPHVARQESKAEFEAAGLDEPAPKSPSRPTKHRKSASKPIANQKSGDKTEKTKASKETANKDETEVFERFEDQKNGERLTSVKPAKVFEKDAVQDREENAPKDADKGLVSGRQALKSWERSGIRFAPWNIPLQRRLQTSVVLFHTLCIALSVSVFFFLCAIPIFWPLLIPYLIYCMTSNASTSGTLSHRSELLRSSPIWSLFASYFPARLHRSVELAPTRKYIFGYHPHGIISHGAFAAFGTEALGFKQLFPGITNSLLTLDSNFRIPIYRDYALAMGLASVSRESCENLLSRGGANREGMGRAITIVVGGARESLDAKPHTMRLVLKRRYGFIKIALRTGADLVPVVAFGENDLYDQFLPDEHPQIHRFQLMVKRLLGFTIPLFHARGVFNYDVGLMPYRRPLNIVVGRPIKVEKVRDGEKPSQEVLERLHGEYEREVVRLWDAWKDEFAPERKEEITIVE